MENELREARAIHFLQDRPWGSGKRLRPIVFLLANSCASLEAGRRREMNGRESRLATAIELFHEASLIHDDIVDRSDIRRGQPTLRMSDGEGLALLIGDYLLFRGLKLVLDTAESREDIRLAQELADTGLAISMGEVQQFDRYLHRRDDDQRMQMATYLDLIAKKTAAFFAGCAEAGAALGGAPPEARQLYRRYGEMLGLVFQMIDDLMDVAGDPAVAKKTLRNNVAEGTVTLPMLHAWALDPQDQALQRIAAGQTLDARTTAIFYRRLSSPQVLAQCARTIDEHAAKAREALSALPPNIHREGLLDMLEYVLEAPWGGLPRPPVAGHAHA